MKTYDSIIFDVDGTLWDSTELVAKAWNEVLHSQTDVQIQLTSETLKSLFGRTLPDIAKELFPNDTTQRQLSLIDICCAREHEVLLENRISPYPGVISTITALAEKYPLFLVSNCEAGYIEVFLEITGLGGCIRDHLCPGDTGNGKADNIKEIVAGHRLANSIYVGDTQGDYEAAKKAGLPFIFASYGFGTVPDPDFTIQTFSDLKSMFL